MLNVFDLPVGNIKDINGNDIPPTPSSLFVQNKSMRTSQEAYEVETAFFAQAREAEVADPLNIGQSVEYCDYAARIVDKQKCESGMKYVLEFQNGGKKSAARHELKLLEEYA